MQSSKTFIKICGITRLEDALLAIELGADALGFVFAPSKRQIRTQDAKKIIEALPPLTLTVGVFVDCPMDEANDIALYTGIDRLQLHGDETPEACTLSQRKVLKRFRVEEGDTTERLEQRMAPYQVAGYLVDPGAGSGKTFDWKIAKGCQKPLIIAGGLNPDNVGELIRSVRPYGVDVASGIEMSPGRKDPAKMSLFIENIRREDVSYST